MKHHLKLPKFPKLPKLLNSMVYLSNPCNVT